MSPARPPPAASPRGAITAPIADSPLVARLRQAGAIVVAKTNVAQLLYFVESSNPLYGRVSNPWDQERTAGGSSGGEGAIIAAGGSPLGLGSDIGGSVRIPAHFCGISALKPTAGRLPPLGSINPRISPQEGIVDSAGLLARRVEDLALSFSLLATGLDAVEPSIPPVAIGAPAEVSLRGLVVGWYTDDGYVAAAPALRRAVAEAAAALRSRGAELVEWRPPEIDEAARLYAGLMGADGLASLRRLLRGGEVDANVRMLMTIAPRRRRVRQMVAALGDALGQPRIGAATRSFGRISTDEYWRLLEDRRAYRARFFTCARRHRRALVPAHALRRLSPRLQQPAGPDQPLLHALQPAGSARRRRSGVTRAPRRRERSAARQGARPAHARRRRARQRRSARRCAGGGAPLSGGCRPGGDGRARSSLSRPARPSVPAAHLEHVLFRVERVLGAPARGAAAQTPGDQMGGAQRLGNLAVQRGGIQQRLRLGEIETGALHEHARHRLHRPGALDQRPLAPSSGNPRQQRLPNGRQIGTAPRHHQHRQPRGRVQRRDIDDVEAAERDPLQEDGVQMSAEARTSRQRREDPGGVGAVFCARAR